MLLAAVFLVGLATAARYCYEAPTKLALPSCTTACLGTDTSVLDGVCADNLKGICELDGGVASFFRVYSKCLTQHCQDQTPRADFVQAFQYQCGWYDSITDVQARYFGEWQIYLHPSDLNPQRSSTVTQRVTSFVTITSSSASKTVSTVTLIGGPTAVSSKVSAEPSVSTLSTPPTTTSASAQTVTAVGDETSSNVLDNGASSTLQISSSIYTRGPASPAPVHYKETESALSGTAIAGIAVGSTCFVAVSFGAIFLILRRRKRSQPGGPRSMSPPIHERGGGKEPYEKAELAGQEVEPRSPEAVVDAPVGRVELDAGSPVSPVWEPVHVSTSERRAKVAQNF
ncbi:hypothetical protein C7974DRAFT_408111 [Boeremia exigua]|uniref:uncharacterized protein n=1 Tax=Boeremia exigua TaxID=749465 RepID=UPI001E8E8B1C|nr:uncharacterized protein C7974DRAFT_408111 [Boeremia exigua]KAH6644430.1 hypothetical protein C7974DRAFT_408111 [Boeremia exigua]